VTHDRVELRIPATSAYVAVLRTAAAGLAARLDFTVDDIEDLRIAVDEACAVLLPLADGDARLSARFYIEPDRLEVAMSVPSSATELPGRNTFAWTVLTALAGEVDADLADGQATITLGKQRGVTLG
jgi:serine/threonine-protein kinase RsbW